MTLGTGRVSFCLSLSFHCRGMITRQDSEVVVTTNQTSSSRAVNVGSPPPVPPPAPALGNREGFASHGGTCLASSPGPPGTCHTAGTHSHPCAPGWRPGRRVWMSPCQILDSQRQRPTPSNPNAPRGGPRREDPTKARPPDRTKSNQIPKASGVCKD